MLHSVLAAVELRMLRVSIRDSVVPPAAGILRYPLHSAENDSMVQLGLLWLQIDHAPTSPSLGSGASRALLTFA